jgi:hypothetical protein
MKSRVLGVVLRRVFLKAAFEGGDELHSRAVLSYPTRSRDEIPVISVAAVAHGVGCFELSGISGQGVPCEGKARYNILALRRVW